MRFIFLVLYSLFICLQVFAKEQKTVAIMTYKVHGASPWDPDSIKTGITGSEEAVIYMSQKLVKLGYKVTVFGDPPAGSIHSAEGVNPRFVDVSFNDGTQFDFAISWRSPFIAKTLRTRAKKVFFWPHDTYHWPLSEEQINGFDDVLWLSDWQRSQWVSVNPGFAKFTKIFGNGINPEQFIPIQERQNSQSCIYASNYARGLEILLDIWPKVKREFPRATLDIYYGWQHWGLIPEEKEKKMRKQVAKLATLGVIEHGLVSHEELNHAYATASLWTYPCIAPETFCITALRAQYAGVVPVIIEGTALKETVRHGYRCQNCAEYLATLRRALKEADGITVEDRKKMQEFVMQEFTWEKLANKWHILFEANS